MAGAVAPHVDGLVCKRLALARGMGCRALGPLLEQAWALGVKTVAMAGAAAGA
jgi:hypothetical protein